MAGIPLPKGNGSEFAFQVDVGSKEPKEYRVRYDSQQSHGDNGRPVRGAVTGHYTVTYPDGSTSIHEHGPHAETDAARKAGANPNARSFAGEHARQAIISHANRAKMHNLYR